MTPPRFARFAWFVLAFNLAVIAWGAYVRASGSGAGCGSHWPLCNGEVVPRAPAVQTMVEFGHRVTSGLALVLVLVMAVWAFRAAPARAPVRRAAVFSGVFIAMEAVIGAGLVLFELVAHNASMKRALSMSLHLVNTFFLLAALVLTAWWGSGGKPIRLRKQGAVPWLLALPAAALLVAGASGGIAALGDTLFPATSLSEGFLQDLSPAAHAFVRLRTLHPFLAAGAGVLAVFAAGAVRALRPGPKVGLLSRLVSMLVVIQVAAGLLNLALLAPIAMQLVHLLLADALWLALMLLAAAALEDREPERAPTVAEGALHGDESAA